MGRGFFNFFYMPAFATGRRSGRRAETPRAAVEGAIARHHRTLVVGAVELVKEDGGTRTDLELVLPDAFLPTDADAAAAAKPASGEDADTKATFWKSALETAPGT